VLRALAIRCSGDFGIDSVPAETWRDLAAWKGCKPDDSAAKNGHRHGAIGHERRDHAGRAAEEARVETAGEMERGTFSRTTGDAPTNNFRVEGLSAPADLFWHR
jgi:hypothetical protein